MNTAKVRFPVWKDGCRVPAVEQDRGIAEDFESAGVADEDANAEDIDLKASAVMDDDGEACECLIMN